LLVEIAAGIEAAIRRIYIELINYPMLFKLNAAALTPSKKSNAADLGLEGRARAAKRNLTAA
jgi:hypothetical protein